MEKKPKKKKKVVVKGKKDRSIQNANLSPGPGPGRPKGQRNYKTIYREALIKLASLNGQEPSEMETNMLAVALTKASKGDLGFYKDIFDRLYGKPVQKKEVTGAGGRPLFTTDPSLAKKYGIDTITEEDSE